MTHLGKCRSWNFNPGLCDSRATWESVKLNITSDESNNVLSSNDRELELNPESLSCLFHKVRGVKPSAEGDYK